MSKPETTVTISAIPTKGGQLVVEIPVQLAKGTLPTDTSFMSATQPGHGIEIIYGQDPVAKRTRLTLQPVGPNKAAIQQQLERLLPGKYAKRLVEAWNTDAAVSVAMPKQQRTMLVNCAVKMAKKDMDAPTAVVNLVPVVRRSRVSTLATPNGRIPGLTRQPNLRAAA